MMGRILRQYPRDSYYLASKFPGYDLSNMDKVEEIFEKQLEKTGMEYFDFYLFHNVCEINIDACLDNEKYGLFDYLMEQKKNGRIKHLGFSAHGSYEVIERFLKAYGSEMEFGQLQINYIDWDFQKVKDKIELLGKYNIPVWVMEPLRGGKLANLPEEYAKKLAALRPDEKVPAWAFRFLQSIPSVTVTLSGMSNFEQMKENIATFETDRPLNDEEMNCITGIAGRKSLAGFSAADKVVGKAAAFFYVLLKVERLYAAVISKHALEVLEFYGVPVEYGELVDAIKNRKGDGFCPMETAVLEINEPDEAVAAVLRKQEELKL